VRASDRVALVTATVAAHLDTDLPLLVDALARRDVDAPVVAWDDAGFDWSSCRCAVVRSTWDYVARSDEFLAWCEWVSGATTLCNPADVIAWSIDKRYLRELSQAGIPCVPTVFHEPGQPVHVPPMRVVVKPATSAGSVDTARYERGERNRAVAHVQQLLNAGRVAMVQPYQEAIDSHGETGLVYCEGEFSHAFRKGAILATGDVAQVEGLYAAEDIGACVASPAERAVGDAALAHVAARFGELLYARVDVVPDRDGAPHLLELELAEPSLFLHVDVTAADRFAAAIATRLER
jgi:glutathione synthase/RimK-type ligase-like ATP-grasp enzyme